MKKILLPIGTFALFAYAAQAATYNATLGEGTYNWNDSEIWDNVPSSSASASITGQGKSVSTLVIDTDVSSVSGNTTITDATVNLIGTSASPAAINFQSNPGDLTLSDAVFHSEYGNISFGSFNQVIATGASEMYVGVGSSVSGSFTNLSFADTSVLTVDGVNWVKNLWNRTSPYNQNEFMDNSVLNVINGATFGWNGYWGGGSNEVYFTDDSKVNISGGSTLQGNNLKLVASGNAAIDVKDSGSALSFTNMSLNENSKINVSDGATISLSNVEINDAASINILSDMSYSGTSINASGTSATINIDGVTLTRTGGMITVGGNTVLNFINGATFSLGHTNGLMIADNAKVVIDNSHFRMETFPYVQATGGEFIFKNGSTQTGSYNFGRYIFSGSSKMTIDNATLSANFHSQGTDVFEFSDTASLNVENGGTLNYQAGYNFGMHFEDSASFNISGGSTVNFTGNAARKVVLDGSASITVGAGDNSVTLQSLTMASGASLIVKGSDNYVEISTFLDSAGAISFVADAYGVSGIQVNSITDMSGILTVDFSKYTGEAVAANLITTTDAFDFQDYVCTSADPSALVNVITRNSGDFWELYYEGQSLVVLYSAAIPEPATYASILGALAIAFALMRRRVRK